MFIFDREKKLPRQTSKNLLILNECLCNKKLVKSNVFYQKNMTLYALLLLKIHIKWNKKIMISQKVLVTVFVSCISIYRIPKPISPDIACEKEISILLY